MGKSILIKLVTLLVVSLCYLEANAYDFAIGNMYYNFYYGNVIVTYRNSNMDQAYSGNIYIPEKVTYRDNTYSVVGIGNSAFRGTSVNRIVIPPTVYFIDDNAFYMCHQLSKVILPNSLKRIGVEAFSDCISLRTIEIPSSVSYIGHDAFKSTNFTDIYCYPTTPVNIYYENCDDTFSDYTGTLHVPATSLAAYFTALGWCNFYNIIGDAIEPTIISINAEDSLSVCLGEQLNLSAIVTPSNATTKDVIWMSTNGNIATVSEGLVTATGLGECDIIAYCYGLKAVCHLSVIEQFYIISLDQHEAMVLPNHILTLTPTATPELPELVVSSSDPSVAAARVVNGKVQVVGIKEGTTTITVGSTNGNSQADSCLVTVYTELGDLNCDGYISISDVIAMINFLLSDDSSAIKVTNADINLDNRVSISDVTALINYLLSGRWPWQHDTTFNVNGITFKMIYVDGGTFAMGATTEQGEDSTDNETPCHNVTLSGYFICETEVTQELWLAVMGNNPSYFTGRLYNPVEQVSWDDCQIFISKLNEMTGKTFRLPTEAEWEFAARGGKQSQGCKYSGSNTIDEVAWYYEICCAIGQNKPDYGTHIVRTKSPNELGLYDMSGNVMELCQDWYGAYSDETQINPIGPSSGSYHVLRGGSWGSMTFNSGPRSCRVSSRTSFSIYSSNNIGLRLAL